MIIFHRAADIRSCATCMGNEKDIGTESGDARSHDDVSDSVPSHPADQKEKEKLPPGWRKYNKVELPTPEQIAQEDFMNNCAVRTVLSGAMGSVLGVVFGIFMGTMDSSVRSSARASACSSSFLKIYFAPTRWCFSIFHAWEFAVFALAYGCHGC